MPQVQVAAEKNFYSLSVQEALAKLQSSDKGLSSDEATSRLQELGPNEFPASTKKNVVKMFISQFDSFFVIILFAASILSFFLGEVVDACIIIAILFLTSLLGFIQEYKGQKSIQQLRKMITFHSKALRDGEEITVDSKSLVPGDIIYLEIGDIVPADARLLTVNNFSCNESALTGEAEPAEKSIEAIKTKNALIHERKNMAFMGSHVASGSATAVIVGTAYDTELGKTASFLKTKEAVSDFSKDLQSFSKMLVYVIAGLTAALFIVNTLLGRPLLESFLFALALAVGVTPEALPIIITMGLSHGALQLSKKKVIVKRLVSIEDLGNMDVLCSDKTGTLTENFVSLVGYFDAEGKKIKEIFDYALLCSDAVKTRKGFIGNSIDVALMTAANKEGQEYFLRHKRIDEMGFDFERKRMSVIVEDPSKESKSAHSNLLLISKGSFDSITEICDHAIIDGKKVPIKGKVDGLREKYDKLSSEGYRVIALASRPIESKKDYSISDEKNLCFMGFLSFFDPPKKASGEYIKELSALGVAVKIITGDSVVVTKELCRVVNLKIEGGWIIDGKELSKMGEKEFLQTIEKYNVFARISPELKLRIVAGVQKNGHTVGFLGDGINDAEALKQANCGITVNSAVDVARESADIILTQKSLLVILDGVREGRKTFGNMIKYLINTISANFGNMFTLAISSLFLPFIPLLPAQVLLINFLSDGPMLLISTDKVDPEYTSKPKKWNIRAISRFMVFFGLISSVFDLITISFIIFVLAAPMDMFRTAWFLESVLSEIMITFAIRTKKPFYKSRPSKWLAISSLIAAVATLGIVYSPINQYFAFVPLPLWFIAMIFGILIAYFAMVEIIKKWFYKKFEI